ncbi:hypothetical protein Pmani_003982 [Petrolisthes manimaculis]|uniref:Uncharacterized protein n=1 Tax=Petrolisthes manimaculis TaxID=1843537 RepID=A0AAE1QFJ1_9EUCA|nr:hypothetical protein Pmani_003982 [Petrolisthes manimaculis]
MTGPETQHRPQPSLAHHFTQAPSSPGPPPWTPPSPVLPAPSPSLLAQVPSLLTRAVSHLTWVLSLFYLLTTRPSFSFTPYQASLPPHQVTRIFTYRAPHSSSGLPHYYPRDSASLLITLVFSLNTLHLLLYRFLFFRPISLTHSSPSPLSSSPALILTHASHFP